MRAEARRPVKYDRPPVVEVACGINFTLERPLKSGHAGLYWSKVAEEFPRCEDAPPIAKIVESADVMATSFQVEILDLPDLRRTWLLNADGTHLIQLQEDRFIYNWKRAHENATYPSYQQVIAGFRKQWELYKAFLSDQGLGTPMPVQLDLTYFNVLTGLPSYFRDHVRVVEDGRFLPEPEAVNWRSQYVLPDASGRLHVQAVTALEPASRKRVIRLDVLARGLPKDMSESGCAAWFDMAHEWITQGFTDLTTPDAHALWGRTA